MKPTRSMTFKLTITLFIVGLIPSLALELNSDHLARSATSAINAQARSAAVEIGDKIDRNLFERYGDVQAFGLNSIVQDQSQWFKKGAKENQIAGVMNSYVTGYGM